MANCQTWAEPTWRRRHSLSVVASVSVAIARELGWASTRSASGGAGSRPAAGRAGRCPAYRAPAGVHRHRPVAARDALKPWQHRSWISVRDPQFAVRAARVLDLYAGTWDGLPPAENEHVICADEKTSIQARCRCHPSLPPGKARTMRVEHDYDRGGALAYLAAWDVHRGQVTGRCEDTAGTAPFSRLVEQVMTAEPYASADRVLWIVDNGSSHRGAASAERMASTWPAAHLIHLPAHASRLDQAEIYVSVVQRKALTPTISPAWTRSATASPRSRSATTPSPGHIPGSSPAPTSRTCYAGSTCTTKPGPMPWRPDLHPRLLTGPTTKSQIVSRAHVPGRSASTDRMTSPHQVSSSVSRSG